MCTKGEQPVSNQEESDGQSLDDTWDTTPGGDECIARRRTADSGQGKRGRRLTGGNAGMIRRRKRLASGHWPRLSGFLAYPIHTLACLTLTLNTLFLHNEARQRLLMCMRVVL